MKIVLLTVGKTEESFLKDGIAVYEKRLKHYVSFEIKEIPSAKKFQKISEQKQKEAEMILNHPDFISADFKILLDESGTQFSSNEFANFLQKQMNRGLKKIVFVVGGSFGFSEKIYEQAGDKISLSKLTFSHQMARLFFVEQLYRAMTILRGEKYHH